MKRLLTGSLVLLGTLFSLPGFAADALIIGAYKDCRVVSGTVMIQPAAIPDADAQNAVAKAEAIKRDAEGTLSADAASLRERMLAAAEALDFETAASLRDQLLALEDQALGLG